MMLLCGSNNTKCLRLPLLLVASTAMPKSMGFLRKVETEEYWDYLYNWHTSLPVPKEKHCVSFLARDDCILERRLKFEVAVD